MHSLSVVVWSLGVGCALSSSPETVEAIEVGEIVEAVIPDEPAVIKEATDVVENFDVVHAPPLVPVPPPRPKDPYLALRYDIDQELKALARRKDAGESVHDEALALLDQRLPQIIEKWKGTRWSYSGTTQVPKQGKIACGYFVSTVLEHAGFDVNRVDLARQASEQILRSVIPDTEIERLSNVSRDQVVKRVEQQGHGVYLVGLDTHIGFLLNTPKQSVRFCHSTRRDRKAGVVCEDARTSPSLKSRYTVLGKLGDPGLLEAWLEDEELPTAHKFQPQADILCAKAPSSDGTAEVTR